jgi:hypothetical protein
LRTQVKKSKNSHRDPESSGLALFASGGWDLLEEMMQLCTKVKNLLKERLENREIYIAIGGLSDSELYYPPLRTQVKKSKNSHRDPESSGLALFASGGWDVVHQG